MKFLTKKRAIEWLASQGIKCSISTLNKLIVQGRGCSYQKFAGKVLYDEEQFQRWAMSSFNKHLTRGSEK